MNTTSRNGSLSLTLQVRFGCNDVWSRCMIIHNFSYFLLITDCRVPVKLFITTDSELYYVAMINH